MTEIVKEGKSYASERGPVDVLAVNDSITIRTCSSSQAVIRTADGHVYKVWHPEIGDGGSLKWDKQKCIF